MPAHARGDAGPAPAPDDTADTTVDFTDEEGLLGGDSVTAPPGKVEHEHMMPDRYKRAPDAGVDPVSVPGTRRRGCRGCQATGSTTVVLLLAGLIIAARRERHAEGGSR